MSFSHQFEPTTLREYDIRGIVGKTLTSEDAFAIGRTFGSIVRRNGGKIMVVGYDGRLSSPMLEEALVQGAVECGLKIMRIGCGPTPMLYYASVALQADGAIMVTGSHNPPDYNGFKMILAGKPFFGEQIRAMGQQSATGDVVPLEKGTLCDYSIREEYVCRLIQDYRGGDRQLKIVWDNGNSSAGQVLEDLVVALPGEHEHIVLNAAIDGTFPAHHPDPTVAKNLAQLISVVRDNKADLGIAFDGDADRIGVVDDKGQILWGDQILILLARDILKVHKEATIIADVKASQVLFDEVARAGGKPLMWKTGHSLIKSKMAETRAVLAGEMSGHIFFRDQWYGFDDALYAAVRVLDIVARMDEPLSVFRDSLPLTVSTPEIRFPCDDRRKFQVIQEIATRLEAEGADVSTIDGVRVNTPDGWWLLRASNTQAVLVARAEAKDSAGLERLKKALVHHISHSGLEAPNFDAS
ncbi:MAG: phosphomannomutase/phosphoglucomutase [Acetobacter sp.]|nr:phosphomannomutase/phosphoglucomutase [Acetobacter sp.]